MSTERDTDVVVVGAGLAGLCAARALVADGLDVLVVEARERVGGRTEGGTTADGTPIELGGQWIGPTQNRMYELVAELGLETFRTFDEGATIVSLDGRTSRMAPGPNAVPKLSPFALADLAQGLARLGRLASRVPLEEPWTAAGASELDSRTFESWIHTNLRTRAGRAYLHIACEAVFAAEARDLSLLHALFYLRSGTDLDTLLAVDRGAQQDRIVGGSIRIAEALAEALGDRVLLGRPVTTIRHGHGHGLEAVGGGAGGGGADGDGVEIVTRGGERITARRAIVTLPPTLAGRLIYDPILPSWRDQLTQRLPAGSVIKTFAVYDEPFWRADGLNGQIASDRGPVKVTFDNTPPEGTPGILLAFLEADDARRMAREPLEERRRIVLDGLAHHFGERARHPIEYLERDWMAEEFSRGCYGAHFTPGAWTSYGHALREPIGPIHWAGAECSPVWNGYMEGAVRSGETTALEVRATFG